MSRWLFVGVIVAALSIPLPARADYSGRYQGHQSTGHLVWLARCAFDSSVTVQDARVRVGSGVEASLKATFGPQAFAAACDREPPAKPGAKPARTGSPVAAAERSQKAHCYQLVSASLVGDRIQLWLIDRDAPGYQAEFNGRLDGVQVLGAFRFIGSGSVRDAPTYGVEVPQRLDQFLDYYQPEPQCGSTVSLSH